MRCSISTEIKKLSNEVAVSPQISIDDVATIQALGYKTIVCNRPDDESSDQASFSEIESAAKTLGLHIVYQPVVSGKINNEDVTRFKKIMKEVPLPICVYCRTGSRSTDLWTLATSQVL